MVVPTKIPLNQNPVVVVVLDYLALCKIHLALRSASQGRFDHILGLSRKEQQQTDVDVTAENTRPDAHNKYNNIINDNGHVDDNDNIPGTAIGMLFNRLLPKRSRRAPQPLGLLTLYYHMCNSNNKNFYCYSKYYKKIMLP
jgi:hypothetical protein